MGGREEGGVRERRREGERKGDRERSTEIYQKRESLRKDTE